MARVTPRCFRLAPDYKKDMIEELKQKYDDLAVRAAELRRFL